MALNQCGGLTGSECVYGVVCEVLGGDSQFGFCVLHGIWRQLAEPEASLQCRLNLQWSEDRNSVDFVRDRGKTCFQFFRPRLANEELGEGT